LRTRNNKKMLEIRKEDLANNLTTHYQDSLVLIRMAHTSANPFPKNQQIIGTLDTNKGHPTFGVQQNYILRRLTPREYARLQGFPESFQIPVSNCQAYKQFGNAVTVPVITAIGKQIQALLEGK
jgi:site-specific DNA-cytosine methylase